MNENEMKSYDVAIIGAGPAGYIAAIKCAQAGKQVICIDNSPFKGGTCLNVGCIPSKVMLHSTHLYHDAKTKFDSYGIEAENIKISIDKVHENKMKVISQLGSGIDTLFSSNKINFLQGKAHFISNKEIAVATNDGTIINITAENIIIATGSQSTQIPGLEVDEKFILSSTGALNLQYIPQNMLIVGCGVIGLEIGSIWSRMGANVTFLERGNHVMGRCDKDIAAEIERVFKFQNMSFLTNTCLNNIVTKEMRDQKPHMKVSCFDSQEDKNYEIDDVDAILLSIGRTPYTQSLALHNTDIQMNGKAIMVNQNLETSVSGVYAIGDVIGGQMLAHKASEEAIAVSEIICGAKPVINYNAIPSVVYTTPEIAFIGKSEEELKAENIAYNIGKFRIASNSRAKIKRESFGFVKIISCAKTDKILGAAIISENAGDIVQSIVVALELGGSADDIARTIFSHPTVGEAIKEAAMNINAKSPHSV